VSRKICIRAALLLGLAAVGFAGLSITFPGITILLPRFPSSRQNSKNSH
jgi:hypothetical protein